MAIFDTFKKHNKSNNSSTDNGILGPTYLDGLTEHIENSKGLFYSEWRRKLKSHSGQTKFKIKDFGQMHEDYGSLIIGSDFVPSLVFAVDIKTGPEILLFDGCKHVFDALLWTSYNYDQIENIPVEYY